LPPGSSRLSFCAASKRRPLAGVRSVTGNGRITVIDLPLFDNIATVVTGSCQKSGLELGDNASMSPVQQLIQDAAVHCRFCRHDVTPTIASSEKWTQFGKAFHLLSASRQQLAWDELTPVDRAYVQKTLGIVPPTLPGIREALSDLKEGKKARKSNSFSGFVVAVACSC